MLDYLKKTDRQKAVLYQSLAQSLQAGLSLFQTFSLIEKQYTGSASIKHALGNILTDIERGNQIHAAMRKFPRIFSPLECELALSGEESGTLDDIFYFLHEHYQKNYSRSLRMVNSLLYPVILLLLTNYIITIPTIITRGWKSYLISTNLRLIIILGVLMLIGKLFKYIHSLPGIGELIDGIKLKLPVLGKVFQHHAVSVFMRVLALNYRAGMELHRAVNLAVSACPNKSVQFRLKTASLQIDTGKSLASVLGEAEIFPPLINQVIATGELTGNIDVLLERVVRMLDMEADVYYKMLTQVAGVIVFLIVAALIAHLVISKFMGIYGTLELID